jgi:hypothetical protein
MNLLLALEDVKMRAGGWANQTTAQPVGIALLLTMIIAVFVVPRRWAIIPFFILACFAARQRVVIATLDFDFIRLLVIFGWMRVAARGEMRGFQWKPTDTIFALWCLMSVIAPIMLHKTTAVLTVQLGQLLTIAGGYYLFRMLVKNWDDIYGFVRAAVFVGIPVAALFLVEKMTARNFFASFGGIPELTQIRYGEIRAQGAYAHPILAGCFWAAMAPMFAALWWKKGLDVYLAVVGVLVCVVISWACASSTPLVGMMAASLAAGMFLLRRNMRAVRWGILGMLIVLQLVKSKPVWHMFVYADLIGGSTGWHRYRVINEAINHFPEWMLWGTKSTVHWGVTDITNQFVLEGIRGGLLTMVLMIALVSVSFGSVGRLWRVAMPRRPEVAMAWALGVTMFVHLTSFMAVSYFGQIVTLLTIHLAMIASLSPTKRAFAVRQRQAAIAQRRSKQARNGQAWSGRTPDTAFARGGAPS